MKRKGKEHDQRTRPQSERNRRDENQHEEDASGIASTRRHNNGERPERGRSGAPYDSGNAREENGHHDSERSDYGFDQSSFNERAGFQGKGFFGGNEAPYEHHTAHLGTGRSVGYGPNPPTHIRGFRGKGPKGYQRSDDRLTEEINERLTYHDGIDASEITVAVQDGEATLTGTVNSRGEKRLAEDICDDVMGVNHVQNNLRVNKAVKKGEATS